MALVDTAEDARTLYTLYRWWCRGRLDQRLLGLDVDTSRGRCDWNSNQSTEINARPVRMAEEMALGPCCASTMPCAGARDAARRLGVLRMEKKSRGGREQQKRKTGRRYRNEPPLLRHPSPPARSRLPPSSHHHRLLGQARRVAALRHRHAPSHHPDASPSHPLRDTSRRHAAAQRRIHRPSIGATAYLHSIHWLGCSRPAWPLCTAFVPTAAAGMTLASG